MNDEDHCDNYIDAYDVPNCLRYYLLVNRLPAVDILTVKEAVGEPKCFATYKGKRVRLVMASRLGDVGINHRLNTDHGYSERVLIKELSEFSPTPWYNEKKQN